MAYGVAEGTPRAASRRRSKPQRRWHVAYRFPKALWGPRPRSWSLQGVIQDDCTLRSHRLGARARMRQPKMGKVRFSSQHAKAALHAENRRKRCVRWAAVTAFAVLFRGVREAQERARNSFRLRARVVGAAYQRAWPGNRGVRGKPHNETRLAQPKTPADDSGLVPPTQRLRPVGDVL